MPVRVDLVAERVVAPRPPLAIDTQDLAVARPDVLCHIGFGCIADRHEQAAIRAEDQGAAPRGRLVLVVTETIANGIPDDLAAYVGRAPVTLAGASPLAVVPEGGQYPIVTGKYDYYWLRLN